MKTGSRLFSRKNDRLLGIPALFAMSGLMSAHSGVLPNKIGVVGVIRMESVRDTLYIREILTPLKNKFPACRIVFFAGADNFDAAENSPCVDSVIRIYPEDTKKSIKIVRDAGAFDIWLDFGTWSRFEAILSCAANAVFKAGFRTDDEHRHYPYDKVAEFKKNDHIRTNYAKLGAHVGLKSVPLPYVQLEKKSKTVVFNMFSDNPSQAARAPLADHWRYLVMALSKKGYKIALTGKTEHKEDAEKFIDDVGASYDIDYYVGRLDWRGLSVLLESSALVISGDSGVLYMAALAGVPCLGVYGAVSARKYAPPAKNFVAVEPDKGCNGCQDFYGDEPCTIKNNCCMDAVSVHLLEEEAMRLLGTGI